ncbi:MAG: class I SAM-dependent methyltransferase family protein [Archaeoglobaceae archaeon]|nr:class I SAM-dependent methyltransferase family protein [Archaeoglobaceae archaeon]MCX8151805.1 class I SAM-dependent methyltransferase family protein [Archaeoglobaceae archaeon]MDW8013169.1 class I SAM-dependent methyltransferase family protein [Archaeoglobaceae archaeon]
MSIKELVEASGEELKFVRRSFEIIGDIAIVEIPEEVIHLKDKIISAILSKHKHIKTVLRKVGKVEGEFRVAKFEIIYGSETETIAREHGCRFLVDPTKVYYTSKLSGERERIARLVRDGERILVMFAGVGPYAIVIAKLSRPSEVLGIELNSKACEYFRKNIELNKVKNVKVLEGDVKDVVPKLEGEFDRIIMPAPQSAEKFVHLLPGKVKVGTWVHYYTFESENKEKKLPEKVKELFKEHGMEVELKNIRKCGSFAPYVNRYVLDLEVKN